VNFTSRSAQPAALCASASRAWLAASAIRPTKVDPANRRMNAGQWCTCRDGPLQPHPNNRERVLSLVAFCWANADLITHLRVPLSEVEARPAPLAEFEYRFNRRYDHPAMFPGLGWFAVRMPPILSRLLKLAEDYGRIVRQASSEQDLVHRHPAWAKVRPQVGRSAPASLDHRFRVAQLCDCRSAEPAFALRPCSAVAPIRRGACAVWRS
jgi:hypothetical protein